MQKIGPTFSLFHNEPMLGNVYHRDSKTIHSRTFFHSAGKVDPYAELVVDGQPPRKTDVVRKTWEPKWMEDFTM